MYAYILIEYSNVVLGEAGIRGREEAGSGQGIACSEDDGWRVRLELAYELFARVYKYMRIYLWSASRISDF